AAALGASESSLPGTVSAEALHTFTLDSTTLTPLSAPVRVRLADPSGGPVLARSSTVLPSCVDLHMYTDGPHLATFNRRPGSSLYTLATKPPQVAASAQVSASGLVAPPCSCRLLLHQTLLWHHCLGHPSLPRLRGMHSKSRRTGSQSAEGPGAPCVLHCPLAPPFSPIPLLHVQKWGGGYGGGGWGARRFPARCAPCCRPCSSYTAPLPPPSPPSPYCMCSSGGKGMGVAVVAHNSFLSVACPLVARATPTPPPYPPFSSIPLLCVQQWGEGMGVAGVAHNGFMPIARPAVKVCKALGSAHYYLCVPPDPGIEVAALGASESVLPSTAPAEALHTFTLDSSASRCFFRDSTTLTPLSAPIPVRQADPSGGPVFAPFSTFLPCPAVAPPCSCRLLSHQTLLWHHHLGHPSLRCLRGMHSRHLVSGLPRSLPPLPPSPALPCLACVEGWQRAAPHSSSFPSTTGPLQTLHMDVWGPARVSGQGRERYFLLRFCQDLSVLCLHSDGGGEFSSDLLRDFCHGEGILQSFTLPDSTQQNGIAERHIGLVMEVARTSMIHAAAPYFLWPFAVRYAAHQLNLWPRVSLSQTSPTLRRRMKVGNASVFRVWGSCAFVRDTSADKLSARAVLCVFLGFSHDAPGWQFYHPTSRRVFPSQDITFDDSVLFYRLFPYRSAPPPPPPLFLAPGPPPVDPLPPQGPAPSGVSQVDPLPGTAPVEVAVGSGAGPGVAASGGAEPGGADYEGAVSGGAEPEGVEPGGPEFASVEPGGAEPEGVEPVGPAGASPRLSPRPKPLSPQQLREWFAQRSCLRSGAVVAGDSAAGDTRAGGAGVTAGAGGTGGAAAAGPGGAHTRDPTEPKAAGAGGVGAGGTGAGGAEAGGAGAVDSGVGGAGSTVRPRPYFVPLFQQVLGVPSSTGLNPPLPCPPPDQSQSPLQPASPLPAPSPYIEQTGGLTERRAPASCPTSSVCTGRRVPRPRPPPVPGTHAMALCPSSVPLSSAGPPSVGGECALVTDVLEDRQEDFECLAAVVPRFASMLLATEGDPDAPDIPTPRSYVEGITGPYSSQWEAAMDAEMASWKSTGTYVNTVPPSRANIVDGLWIFKTFSPTPKMTTLRVLMHVAAQRHYELHSLDFSTAFLQGSLHEEIRLRHPPGFTGSFPVGTQWSLPRPVYGLRQAPREWHDTLRTTLAALGFAPSTADPSLFLRTDTSLPPFYVLVYVDDLVFATADTEALTLVNSELQKRHTCTDLGEPRSYLGLLITRDRARCTIILTQSHMVHQVLQRFGFQFSSPQPTPLSTGHSLSAPPSDESIEPSGPYPELVGCLMYLMMCTRPDLVYRLSLLARYVPPGRHRKVHWDAAKRVLRYLCSTSGMGLVLGGRGPVVLTGYADAS
ncbi:unnamed protein product, partial [Closterium sp. NIES-54]